MTDLQNTRRPGNVKDITGVRFTRLMAVRIVDMKITGVRIWLCQCDCGNTINVPINSLTSGNTRSCGCLFKEKSRESIKKAINITHGLTKRGMKITKEYRAWGSMNNRCSNPRHKQFDNYGGRGIKVCERWKSFEVFLADMGTSNPGTTLERIDNNLGYCKDNCKWATITEQNRNKRGVKLNMEMAIAIKNDNRSQYVIAKEYGVSRSAIEGIKTGRRWQPCPDGGLTLTVGPA